LKEGKVSGVSKKAKSISIVVGKGDKAKTMMVKFDDNTKGMEFAKKGEAAIIEYVQRDTDKYATIIKPKLAKLPEGVTEIQPAEVAALVDVGPEKGAYLLVDSRPAKRYADGHLPTAISIPVEKLKEEGETLLPKDKDQLIVFHCGGPT